jgi:hypothetical protein
MLIINTPPSIHSSKQIQGSLHDNMIYLFIFTHVYKLCRAYDRLRLTRDWLQNLCAS